MRPINLLPPEVAHEKYRRRRMYVALFGVFLYLVLLGFGVFYWNGKVSDARADRDVQLDVNRSLERELVVLADAGDLQERFDAKAELVRLALTNDVDWGIILNDLARLLPPRTWVETFTGTVVAETTPGVVGQVSFSGVGLDFPDVSAWLRSLDSEQFVGITGTWVNTASESVIGEDEVVTFSSTAVLTQGAVTQRAELLIPEVP
jgi:Tfp pilus assembly protein PilN